jgi:hypothetical protein
MAWQKAHNNLNRVNGQSERYDFRAHCHHDDDGAHFGANDEYLTHPGYHGDDVV